MKFKLVSAPLLAVILIVSSCKNNEPSFFRGKRETNAAVPSQEIPIALAKAMRSHYKNTTTHFKTVYLDPSGNPVGDTLEGFRFKVSDIEEVIRDANGKKAKDVIFYFGRDASDVTVGGRSYPSYAIITMAVDSSNKLANKAYDKADPCPPFCPDDN